MTGHYIEKYALYPQVDDIIRKFQGRWGQTNGIFPWNTSPNGPLYFNGKCDHDYRSTPAGSDWATAC